MSGPDQRLKLSFLSQGTATQPRSGSSTTNTSPIGEQPPSTSRSPFGIPSNMNGAPRKGAGSPSHEMSGRLYSKRSAACFTLVALVDHADASGRYRAREIQAQEGLTTPSVWGPPASGTSTPLRETIPESPSQDGFPDFVPPSETALQNTPRRARAGTVPSRFSPGNGVAGLHSTPALVPKTSRPTPSTSPFRPLSATSEVGTDFRSTTSPTTSALLSRLRAGSMPQRSTVAGPASPFNSSHLSAPWGVSSKDRVPNLSSVRSPNNFEPAAQPLPRDNLADADVKTLDYLGLAETPQPGRATLAQATNGVVGISAPAMFQPFFTDLVSYNRSLSRYRSYSVNAKEKYAEDEEDEMSGVGTVSGLHSGTLTPSAASAAAALAATQAQIHQHNLAVQAFANQASASRPRARTAGVLDSPLRGIGRNYLATPSRLDSTYTASDLHSLHTASEDELSESLGALHIAQFPNISEVEAGDATGSEGPSRALWLGSIPNSTTVSSLQAIFASFGKIESTRVLVQKNCGFVNFETIDPAIRAKAMLNGKEIFPGAGPVRIGFAKAPTANTGGSGGSGLFSPSPELHGKVALNSAGQEAGASANGSLRTENLLTEPAHSLQSSADLSDLHPEIMQIVAQMGANESEVNTIDTNIRSAIAFTDLKNEIQPILEPGHTRVYDAPKLREIRKKIDNNAISQPEIEDIAIAMLPEIAELSSDYLGNTVVQKLFEFCSEPTKETMLSFIAPHLAEIGVHKNGTWAAQKIIDVARTRKQISMIADSLKRHTVALFLDQYGNYVLQCCLRFGSPWNNFIFEIMMSRLWEIAQGRFGARAMRACLESHHATKDQQRMVASAIALRSVQLAVNANGALLLTWFLDTCTFPGRRAVLAPRIVPYLSQLCTHKIAYLTVLKVINQRAEPEARDLVLQSLFFSEGNLLEDILSDQACGATLVFKVLTTPFLEENMRAEAAKQVRSVLLHLKVTTAQGYKRLMDEVGLSSRASSKAEREPMLSSSLFTDRGKAPHAHNVVPGGTILERQSGGQYPATASAPFASIDPAAVYDQFNMASPVFTPTSISAHPMPYQNSIIASSRNISPTGMYAGFPTSGSYENFQSSTMSPRGQQTGPISPSPLMQGTGYPPPGFPLMTGYAGYNQFPFYPQQQVSQMIGGRRGRVSLTLLQHGILQN